MLCVACGAVYSNEELLCMVVLSDWITHYTLKRWHKQSSDRMTGNVLTRASSSSLGTRNNLPLTRTRETIPISSYLKICFSTRKNPPNDLVTGIFAPSYYIYLCNKNWNYGRDLKIVRKWNPIDGNHTNENKIPMYSCI
jgi:hypothetical protein